MKKKLALTLSTLAFSSFMSQAKLMNQETLPFGFSDLKNSSQCKDDPMMFLRVADKLMSTTSKQPDLRECHKEFKHSYLENAKNPNSKTSAFNALLSGQGVKVLGKVVELLDRKIDSMEDKQRIRNFIHSSMRYGDGGVRMADEASIVSSYNEYIADYDSCKDYFTGNGNRIYMAVALEDKHIFGLRTMEYTHSKPYPYLSDYGINTWVAKKDAPGIVPGDYVMAPEPGKTVKRIKINYGDYARQTASATKTTVSRYCKPFWDKPKPHHKHMR